MIKLIIVGGVSFVLGFGFGAGAVLRKVKSGRLVANGRIYQCRDTGPKVG